MRLLKHILSVYLLFAFAATTFAQVTVKGGPMLRKRKYEHFLRVMMGGDGYFYAFKSKFGRYWNFSPEGEQALEIIRFTPELVPCDTLRIRLLNQGCPIKNAYEAILTPNGIGLLTLVKQKGMPNPKLQIGLPHFEENPVRFDTMTIADLPAMNIGSGKPGFRVVYSPDSSHIAIAWRRLPNEDIGDNALGCVILDRDLHIVRPVFSPFQRFEKPVSIREMNLLDENHLLFTAETWTDGIGLLEPGTMASGMLHYDIADAQLRVIKLTNGHQVPLDTRIGLDKKGRLIAAGWYLDQNADPREVGVFIGRMTRADSLEDLHCYVLSEDLRNNLLLKEKQNGALALRSSYQTELLPTSEGVMYVMHIRGALEKDIEMKHPGTPTNNHLLAWQFGNDFVLKKQTTFGFLNQSHEELYESFSWRPFYLKDHWYALATDYSAVKREASPWQAATYLWDIKADTFEKIYSTQKHGFEVLCPREMAGVKESEWVGIAVSGRRWRLVKVRM